jgi:hypothetical protein
LRQQFTLAHWKEPEQPHWYYKLAETVRLFYDNHSDLTVRALCYLKSRSQFAFDFAPEINLLGFPGDSDKREMDIACIVDGDIVFGECKTEPLRPRHVNVFKTLIGMPIKTPSQIVFATTRDVSVPFREEAGRLGNSLILTRSDLYDGSGA